MKISINWLRDYIYLDDLRTSEISDLLTMTGLEVEGIERFESIPGGLKGLVIGEIIDCRKHPNADKLSLTKVDIGKNEPRQIVCGAPNVAKGQKVVVAPVNTTISPLNHEPFTIKKAKIRGEVSEGMICAEDEIGLGKSHEGILVLDTSLPNGTPVTELFPVDTDQILEIGITPNRSDAISHLGTARDLKASLKREICPPPVDPLTIDTNDYPVQVTIEDPAACTRYSGISLSEVTVGPSPTWLQNKLKAIGLTPINNVVDITNFVMHETGQPLHAFDLDKVANHKVIVKTLPENTPFVTLDEKERKLHDQDLMICDEKGAMCIAGVFGGASSGVSDGTSKVFLESAVFSPDYVRKTSSRHLLKTDASFRFERGVDPNGTLYALKRAALLIRELGSGKIASDIVDVYPEVIEPVEVELSIEYVQRLIGKSISPNRIEEILKLLDFEFAGMEGEVWKVRVPTYRTDVKQPADVVEEVLRIYGFNNVELSENLGSTFLSPASRNNSHRQKTDVTKFFTGAGYFEIFTNSLTKASYVDKFEEKTEELVRITNSNSEDLAYMKPKLLWPALEVLRHNQNRKQPETRFFEFGKAYGKKSGSYWEKEFLGIYLTGESENSWYQKSYRYTFYDISSICQMLLTEIFRVDFTTNTEGQHSDFQYSIDFYGKNDLFLGTVGKIREEVAEYFEVRGEVFHAFFDWKALLMENNQDISFTPIPKFPEVKRDLSLVLDKRIPFKEVEELGWKFSNHLLKSIQVFDVYEGEKIEKGKKAYAITFTLQDPEKTLTDKMIDKTMDKLMKAYEKELQAFIRK